MITASLDWFPGIREACNHWRVAPMQQQNLEALEQTLDQNNDACIDCENYIGLSVETDDEGLPNLQFLLQGGDVLPLCRLLSQLYGTNIVLVFDLKRTQG